MSTTVTSVEALQQAIEDASWFESLGSFQSQGLGIPVSPSAWRALSAESLEAEFRVSARGAEGQLPEFSEWLPTSVHQPDPVRGPELAELEASAESAVNVRELRLAITRVAARSLSRMHPHELLSVGPVDYWVPARAAATFACRSAATEIAFNSPRFWAALIPIYSSGHWPFNFCNFIVAPGPRSISPIF